MDKYHVMRKPFEPATVKLVLVGESPPAWKKGECKYFYNVKGNASEKLFHATMQALGIDCGKDKEKGLREFQQRGVLLLDMVYRPVNDLHADERYNAVEDGFDDLVETLSLLPGVPVAFVVADLYKRFYRRLRKTGVNVIDRKIPFPARRQEYVDRFCEELASIIAEHNI
jgi:hypothetical protein